MSRAGSDRGSCVPARPFQALAVDRILREATGREGRARTLVATRRPECAAECPPHPTSCQGFGTLPGRVALAASVPVMLLRAGCADRSPTNYPCKGKRVCDPRKGKRVCEVGRSEYGGRWALPRCLRPLRTQVHGSPLACGADSRSTQEAPSRGRLGYRFQLVHQDWATMIHLRLDFGIRRLQLPACPPGWGRACSTPAPRG
jgi:hypothetical protein